jgi:hypothetical protein
MLVVNIQQFASKHKPQTFSRVFLRLKRGVYRWKLKCIHRSCDVSQWKALSNFWRNCHVLMCLRTRFNISEPMRIRSSHKKYEYKQVWPLLQYRELGNTETYTKAHQNMKNNWIRLCTVTRHMSSETFPLPTINCPFQT